MPGPADAGVETVLLRVLIQLIVIIAASRIAGVAFRKLGQPQVCGEVAAGLILGPSLLGKLAPNLFSSVFAASTGPVLNILSQLGLILLMFLVGLEFDFAHLKTHGKTAVAISIVGIALPFGLGILLAQFIHPWVAPETNSIGFALLLTTALAITAIPVLSRIMMELNLQRTDIGSMSGALLWTVAGMIIVAAIIGKLGGCSLAARFVGKLSWRDSATIGILMNTRGLMELIVINLGYELHVFPRSVFFMLVMMTLVTTYMTTPLVRRAIRNTSLDRLVQESSFILGHRKAAIARSRP